MENNNIRNNENSEDSLNPFLATAQAPNLGQREIKNLESLLRNNASTEKIANLFGKDVETIKKWEAYYNNIDETFIKENIPNLETLETFKFNDQVQYTTKGKKNIRDVILQQAINTLEKDSNGRTKIKYLGLEGPNFGSYIRLSEMCNIDSKNSLVVERNMKAYLPMRAIINSAKNEKPPIKGSEIFKGLKLYNEDVNYTLKDKYCDMKFNLVNLDYMGEICDNKVRDIERLFTEKRLEDTAMMCVTLNNSNKAMDKIRSYARRHNYKTTDQEKIMTAEIEKLAKKNGYSVRRMEKYDYDGTNTRMMYIGYKIEKLGEKK